MHKSTLTNKPKKILNWVIANGLLGERIFNDFINKIIGSLVNSAALHAVLSNDFFKMMINFLLRNSSLKRSSKYNFVLI